MPADQLLNTLLRRFQDPRSPAETDSFVATTAHLLATLSNPLNVGVLTTQFLAAPAIWRHGPDGTLHDDLQTCLGVMSVYNSGANRVRAAANLHQQTSIGCDGWAKAVAAGLDARSRRWQHLLVLTGVLLGLETETDGGVVVAVARPGLSAGMRATLEEAVVRAANLSLETETTSTDGPVCGAAVVLALGYALPLLSRHSLARLDHDTLLPLAIWAMTDAPAFEHGAFLVAMAGDGETTAGGLVHWPAGSASFQLVARLSGSPLVSGLGAVSRLAGHAARHVRDRRAVLAAQAALAGFTGLVLARWRGLALAAVDPAEEHVVLSPETAQVTAPALRELLKKLLYSVVVVMQAIGTRCLEDGWLVRDATVATATLRALRSLCFISSRDANRRFDAYAFTYLSAVDVLSRFPAQCEALLRDIAPAAIPQQQHATDRALDLFYLDLVEHLPLVLSTTACRELMMRPALAYLGSRLGSPLDSPLDSPPAYLTAELFESSHSVVLAALSAPHNAVLAAEVVPLYADMLSAAFPSRISPRQFRLALGTVVRITSPPFPASASHPDLAEALLEMIHFRSVQADPSPLPPRESAPDAPAVPFSEQSALVMALVDALPSLPLRLVEEWLTITAGLVGAIQDPVLRGPVRERFWDVLVGGEMDVDRAAMGVAWWAGGGRDLVRGVPARENI